MRERILHLLSNHGALVQTEAVDYILSKKEPVVFVQGVLDNYKEPPLILTVEHLRAAEKIGKAADSKTLKDEVKEPVVQESVEEEQRVKPKIPKPRERVLDRYSTDGEIAKRKAIVCSVSELPGDINLFKDITGNSTCEGTIGDFKLYFNDRLKSLRKLLRGKRQMVGTRNINKIARADGTIKVIGIVTDIRRTKNGHKLISLEDESGTVSVLLHKEGGLSTDSTVHDEVIGIIGSKTKDGGLLMAKEVVRPDVQVNRTPKRSKELVYAAFISDIHVGSNTFLKDEFSNFISWLNGRSGVRREVAEKVGYVVIPGDVVDGIGVYPSQEEELAITDIYGQYEELARLLASIPDNVKVIMLPGNHDAVRPAEPQPTFPAEIRNLFSENVIFLGNPCYFSLGGVEILAYHGRSMDDFIKALPALDYKKAIRIMEEMLKKRHLVPIYGGRTPIAPEHRDYLVIDRIPDIFVTGHGHATGMSKYRGVTLINASCWQSQTNFQKMHNFTPDPAKTPIYNLQTGEASIMDFS